MIMADQNDKKLDRDQLNRSIALVRSTLESTADGILVVSKEGELVDWNKKFTEIMDVPDGVLKSRDEGKGIKILLSKLEDPQSLMSEMMMIAKDPMAKGELREMAFKDGRTIERYSQPHIVDNEVVGRVWSFRDITQQRQAEQSLLLYQRAIEASPNGVVLTDASKKNYPIIYVNRAFEKITGYRNDEMIGKPWASLFNYDSDQNEIAKLEKSVNNNGEETAELRCNRKNGEMYWNEVRVAPVQHLFEDISDDKLYKEVRGDSENKTTHYVTIVSDVTERKAMEEQLQHQVTHDALTGLPNRILLHDRIKQAVLYAHRAKGKVGILFLDLDNFKLVNDALGHKMGDHLLQSVASRLSSVVRATDTVARLGGDEFVVVLAPLEDESECEKIAEKILGVIHDPIQVEERELHITTSIGISMFPTDGHDGEILVQNADTAMYQAKDNGRDNIQFFTTNMNKNVSERLSLYNKLRAALAKQELSLVYQPVVELESETVTGVEALLRWKAPFIGNVSPAEFIPLAEETGLIVPIGEWVLKTACIQAMEWKKRGLPDIKMSVNISGRQLKHTDIVATLVQVLDETGMSPQSLVLELTESMLMDYAEETIGKLIAIREMGITIAIDDFGTGYSSLSYLRELPVDKLKIDRAFVTDIDSNDDNAVITQAIIAMAQKLKLKVLAEGAERKEEIDFLRAHQCSEIQGYYFSKPLTAEGCEKYIKKHCHIRQLKS